MAASVDVKPLAEGNLPDDKLPDRIEDDEHAPGNLEDKAPGDGKLSGKLPDDKYPANGDSITSKPHLDGDIEMQSPPTQGTGQPPETTTSKETPDPNIVDWDGPDDPEMPLNWSTKKKWTNGALLSAMTFLTYFPLSSL